MFCPNCGTESHADDRFCKNCGTTLRTVEGAQSASASSAGLPQQAAALPVQAPYAPAPMQYVQPQAIAAYPPPVYPPYAQIPQQASSSSPLRAIFTTAVVLIGLGAGVFYYLQNGKKVIIGTKDEVFYSGQATKDQATALGNALKADGYFEDKGVTVLLSKGSSGTVISFVVKDGFWNQAGTLSGFEEIGRTVAPTVGGLPVQINLDDTNKDVEKSSTIGEAAFDGGDGVFYEGSATLAQAQAVGQRLKSDGFFEGKGANVFVVKHDNAATTLMFVVGSDAWDDPQMVNDFEVLARDVAQAAGGLPIDMQLVTSDLTVKKDEVLN